MTRRDPWDVLELAERAATVVDGQHEGALAELLAAADDVAPALATLSATDNQAALRLAGSLSAFWQDSGRVDEGRRATEALLADISQRDTGPYARALLVASELAFRQGDQDAAGGHARDAIELGQQSGDTGAVGLARGLPTSTSLAWPTAPATRRGSSVRHAALWRRLPMTCPRAAERCTCSPGRLTPQAIDGPHASASRTALRFAASWVIDLGSRVEEANVGDLAAEDGELQEAAARLGAALRVADDVGSRYLVLNLLPSIAAIAARTGADADCARLLGATDALSRVTGLIPDPGNWQSVFDDAKARLGEQFDRLTNEGRQLSERAAVDVALDVADRAAAGVDSAAGRLTGRRRPPGGAACGRRWRSR